MDAMEQFLTDVAAYAESVGLAPGTVVQNATNASGSIWKTWLRRDAYPTVRTMDRVRAYMVANPPKAAANG